MSIIALIKSSPLFVELYDSEVENILKTCQVLTLTPNEFVFREGDNGNELYILLTGEVAVKKGDMTLATLSKGDLFGEMVLINERTRTADVMATNYTDILIVSYDSVFNTFNTDTRVFSILMLNLSRMLSIRLKKAGVDLAKLSNELQNLKK